MKGKIISMKMVKEYFQGNKKDILWTMSLSFIIGLSLVTGSMIDKKGYLDLAKSWEILIMFLLVPVGGILLQIIMNKIKQSMAGIQFQKSMKKEKLCLVFAFFLICWGIVLAGVYPGFFVYDATDELNQVLTRNFTTHHPLFHVLYLGGIVQAGYKIFGSYNAGIFCLMLVQMFSFAAGFTYLLSTFSEMEIPSKYSIITMVFLGVFPVIPMMVLCSSKDSMFALCLLLWTIEIYKQLNKENKYTYRLGIIWGTGMILLRKNAVYALVITAILFFLFYRKKKISTGIVISIVTGLLISGVLSAVFHAKAGEHQEILTVPIQQIARVYTLTPELLTEEEKEEVTKFVPEEYLMKYEPKLSDPVKIGFDNEAYSNHKSEFFKIWWKIGKKAPVSYLNAWLLTSYGYWYPYAKIDVYRGHCVYTFTYEDNSYFGYETEQPGERISKISLIDQFYRKLSLENVKEKVPFLRLFFAPGFMFLLFLFQTFYLGKTYGIKMTAPYWCICLIMATLLLGPTFLPRYVFFLWPCVLFQIADMMTKERNLCSN